jgi:hypothetical protein
MALVTGISGRKVRPLMGVPAARESEKIFSEEEWQSLNRLLFKRQLKYSILTSMNGL